LQLQSQLLSNELTAVLRQRVRGYVHLETRGLVNVFIMIELDNRQFTQWSAVMSVSYSA